VFSFASDEYPEFTGTIFNDAFGLFIKGGSQYATATNLALVPGTNEPISVNTINDGHAGSGQTSSDVAPFDPSHSNLYISNSHFSGDGTTGPYLEYDGLTVLLSVSANVTRGTQYSMKVAIADVGDNNYDSAVFFKPQGFTALSSASDNAYAVSEDATLKGNVILDNTGAGTDVTAAGNAVGLNVTAINGHALTGSPVTLASGSVLGMAADGSFTFKPSASYQALKTGQTATETFDCTITDANGVTGTAHVTVTITGANEAPVVVNPHLVDGLSNKDGQTIAALNAGAAFADPGGGHLSFEATGLPKGLTIDPKTGVVSGNLDSSASLAAPYTVTISAHDAAGLSTSISFEWKITDQPPVILGSPPPVSVVAGEAVTIELSAYVRDPDGDPIRVLSASATSGSVRVHDGGELVYQPKRGFEGRDVISYSVSNGNGGSETGHIAVNVKPGDTAPIVILGPAPETLPAIPATMDEGQTRTLDTVARAMAARIYILNAVNGISNLGGLQQVADANADISSETASRVGFSPDEGATGEYSTAGLQGFSLHTTYDGINAEVAVETLVGHGRLYIDLTATMQGAPDPAVEWSITQADGQELPGWISQGNGQSLIATIPPSAEHIALKISARFPHGETAVRYVTIDLKSGEIQALKPPRTGGDPALAPRKVSPYQRAGLDALQRRRPMPADKPEVIEA
jgi:VCBS repeat-containing protein